MTDCKAIRQEGNPRTSGSWRGLGQCPKRRFIVITYKDAGVDVERGYEAVRRMKQHVAATFDENVLGGLGSFGGF